jgi:hypothetical protein
MTGFGPGNSFGAAWGVSWDARFVHVGRGVGQISKAAGMSRVQKLQSGRRVVDAGMEIALGESRCGTRRQLAEVLLGGEIVTSSKGDLAQAVESVESRFGSSDCGRNISCDKQALGQRRRGGRVLVRRRPRGSRPAEPPRSAGWPSQCSPCAPPPAGPSTRLPGSSASWPSRAARPRGSRPAEPPRSAGWPSQCSPCAPPPAGRVNAVARFICVLAQSCGAASRVQTCRAAS